MIKKILCLTAALILFAVFTASAETTGPVTAEELSALLESVRAEALAAEPLNDPADEEAQNEDGTLIQYASVRFYAAGETLTADVPVNAMSFDEGSQPVLRGVGIYSMPEELLAAFPNENAELAGTREEAVLYLQGTADSGFVYGRILRDGQRISAVEYGEVLPERDDFRRAAVTYTLISGLVTSIRAEGLNPDRDLMDASHCRELYDELQEIAGRDDYRAVKTSRNGLELAPFSEEDLFIDGISYTDLQPFSLSGIPEQELIDNEDGTWLLRCDGDGYAAVFLCDEQGENTSILSFTLTDDTLEGPRCVRIGDLFSEDFCRFRNRENEMGEDMTELLYGDESTASWGKACYDPDDMSLRYVTETSAGIQVELILKYENNLLAEIILQTI